MKNEAPQPKETQRTQVLPVIKLLSLATAALGVLYHGWIDMMGGGWLIWLVLVLLMLLEAGATEARAAWGQAQAMVRRMLGPAMLPFYGALCLLLAVGPSYVRQAPGYHLPVKAGSLAEASGGRTSPKPGTISGAPIPSNAPRQPISSLNQAPIKKAPPVVARTQTQGQAQPQPQAQAPTAASGIKSTATSPGAPGVAPSASPPSVATPAMVTPTVFQRPAPIQPSGSARPVAPQ